MSEEAEKELKRTALRNQLSSIFASLAVMLLGGGALFFAVILIVQEAPAVFVSYVPPHRKSASLRHADYGGAELQGCNAFQHRLSDRDCLDGGCSGADGRSGY